MTSTFLKWTGLTTATLICGGVAAGTLHDLITSQLCYSIADGPMYATFMLFALAGGVLAGLLALMIRSVVRPWRTLEYYPEVMLPWGKFWRR